MKTSIKLLKTFLDFLNTSKILHSLKKKMARTETTPRRGLRQPRAAAQASRAINSALLGIKKDIGPDLAANVDFNVASSSAPTAPVKLGRPKASGGIGVKKNRRRT